MQQSNFYIVHKKLLGLHKMLLVGTLFEIFIGATWRQERSVVVKCILVILHVLPDSL